MASPSEAEIAACYSVCGNTARRCFAAAGATMGTLSPSQIMSDVRLLLCNEQFAECERRCRQTRETDQEAVSSLTSIGGALGEAIPYVAAACTLGYSLYTFFNSYYSQPAPQGANSDETNSEESQERRPSKEE